MNHQTTIRLSRALPRFLPGLVPCLLLLGACEQGATSGQGGTQAIQSQSLDPTSGELTLAQVQEAIAAAGAGWSAGDTTVSALPRADRLARLGVPLTQIHAERIRVLAETDAGANLPPVQDWRNNNGQNFVSPILDQGRCGSCVAFASIGTFETQLNIAAGDTSSPWQLSPQYIFSCGGGACDWGWDVGSAAQFLVDSGAPDNSCMPYTSGAHDDDASCSAACSDVGKRAVKATSYTTPTSGGASVTAVKNALMKGPLMTTMTVYDDFMYYTGGVYKHVTGNVAGGHALSIVGWNDADQAWIVRNSWGADWGVGGFFEIAWSDSDSGLADETWLLSVPAPGPYVALVGLRDGAVLSGAAQPLTFEAKNTSQVSWSLSSGTTLIAAGGSSDAIQATIDTTKLKDGVYTLQAHAGSGSSKVDGELHTVYVLNGQESGSIAFASLTNGQTLSGEAEFDINVSSAPIPLTRVDWTIADASGKVVVTRTTANTGPVMQLAWNTTRWPNGAYTITVSGAAGTQGIAAVSRSVTIKN